MGMDGIVTQFAEEAAFLWFLRNNVVCAPHILLKDLALFDERLEAHLDGLRVAGEAGWEMCRTLLDSGTAEGVFPAAILAFEDGRESRVGLVVEAVNGNPERARAAISALGWLPYEVAEPHLKVLLRETSPSLRYIGVASSAIHRRDPGHLTHAAWDLEPAVKARALRAQGELGRSRVFDTSTLKSHLSSDDERVRFSAAWSASLARNGEALNVLTKFVHSPSPFREKALNAVLRGMEHTAALSLHKSLATSPDTVRLAVVGAGVIGDPFLVPWLLDFIGIPALARVAGEAFTMISGVEIRAEGLKAACPEGFEPGPNDNPDDDAVTLDVDRDLPWPDAAAVQSWWGQNRGNYKSGLRHFVGKPLTAEHLRQVLRRGTQRQRLAAAFELTLLSPGEPLFEVRAPAFRQMP